MNGFYLINYLLALFLISAVIYNLFFSRRNRVEVEGYSRVNGRFEDCAAEDFACAAALAVCFETLEASGFDRLCALGKSDTHEIIFVFINKNYSIYLELYCFAGVIKNIELMSQFYDSKIYITTTDAEKKVIDSHWIAVECITAASEADFSDNAVKNLIESLIEKHTAKLLAAHSGPVSPYYATPSGYASCKNYVNDIMKLDRMAAD
jgi:hypothetical protein